MSFAEIESFSWAFVLLSVGVAVRSTFLAIICAALDWLLRSRPAEIRHALWRGMLVALLLFPILQITLPPVWHASPALSRAQSMLLPQSQSSSVITRGVSRPMTIGVRSYSTAARRVPWMLMLTGAYLAEALAFAVRLALSLRRLKGTVARSKFIGSVQFAELVHDAWLESGSFIRPRVRVSTEVHVPVAVESDADVVILLPHSWQRWDETKLRLVMLHEMCHVKRNDPATTLLACFATCIFWFHPLAWFLKRRLASLAEDACDEFVVERASTLEGYARILLDFAQDVADWHGRIPEPSSAVASTSRIERRIERIVTASEIRRSGLRIARGLVIAVFAPALYLAAAARINSTEPRAIAATADQAAQFKAELKTNPDDLNLRRELLMYYWNQREGPNYIRELLWMIQHHPEDGLASASYYVRPQGGLENTPDDYRRIAAAWEHVLSEHPVSADVLFNAGLFLQNSDAERSLELLQEARQLDASHGSPRYVYWSAQVYAAAVAWDSRSRSNGINLSPELALQLRNQIESSTDPALLSAVGDQLVQVPSYPGHIVEAIRDQGFDLLQRAVDLDPTNPRWKEVLEAAKWDIVRQRINKRLMHALARGEIQIGPKVAEANLITKVDPQYSPLALAARIQGTVEFTVTIGPEGHVQKTQLVRGHPLLVQAAAAALQQWVYQPTLLNGRPVAVLTTVAVPCRLPQ